MTYEFFIVVAAAGNCRMLKSGNANLGADELMFPVHVEIPDEAFTRPKLPTIKMKIPLEAIITEVEAEVTMPTKG